MFKIVDITSSEAWKIRLVILGILIYGLLNLIIPFPDILRYLLGGTGIYKDYESSCLMLNIFGIPCAFCGMSRSLLGFFIPDIDRIFYFNPTAIIFYPVLVIITSLIIILSFKNKKLKPVNQKIFNWVMISLFLIIWIMNILYGHQE